LRYACLKAIGADKKGRSASYGHAVTFRWNEAPVSRVEFDFSGRPGPAHEFEYTRAPASAALMWTCFGEFYPGLRQPLTDDLHIDNLKGSIPTIRSETVSGLRRAPAHWPVEEDARMSGMMPSTRRL